jgi:hypothetical protein
LFKANILVSYFRSVGMVRGFEEVQKSHELFLFKLFPGHEGDEIL